MYFSQEILDDKVWTRNFQNLGKEIKTVVKKF